MEILHHTNYVYICRDVDNSEGNLKYIYQSMGFILHFIILCLISVNQNGWEVYKWFQSVYKMIAIFFFDSITVDLYVKVQMYYN